MTLEELSVMHAFYTSYKYITPKDMDKLFALAEEAVNVKIASKHACSVKDDAKVKDKAEKVLAGTVESKTTVLPT